MSQPAGPPLAAVDLGGTWVRVALFEEGRIRHRARSRTPPKARPEAVVDLIGVMLDDGRRSASLPRPERLAIGVPGPVDPVLGVVSGAPNLPLWRSVPLREMLEKELGCPCLVDHDATLAALGEHRHGAGRGAANFAYITVSTGIGAGMVLAGRLYRGGSGAAGEFGHVVVDPDGPVCGCGRRGCLEAVASGTAIAREAKMASSKAVAEAAAAGDPRAAAALATAARFLGLAVGGLINLLNPEVVAFGGGVFGAGRQFWDQMVAAVAEGSFPSPREHCRLLPTQLGDDQGLLGAYELAREAAGGEGH